MWTDIHFIHTDIFFKFTFSYIFIDIFIILLYAHFSVKYFYLGTATFCPVYYALH